MFNVKNKALIAVGGTVILAIIILLTVNSQLNIAAVIAGVPKAVNHCIDEIPGEASISDYDAIKTRLNTGSEKDYILKGNTDSLCGSAGCIHQLCIITDNVGEIIPFAYAAETLIVKDTITSGMHDLQLKGKSTSNLQWDGSRYIILQ